ncbi:MAG: hypothetical protein R2777_02885 [Chitinophagales bacterium]
MCSILAKNPKSIEELTSHWPDGGDAIPKSGVIVISGEFGCIDGLINFLFYS